MFTLASRAAPAALVLTLALAAAGIAGPNALAAEYTFRPDATIGLSFTDNRAFADDDTDSRFDSRTAGSLNLQGTFGAATEINEFSVTPYVRFRRFSSNDRANSDDQGVSGSFRRTGERTLFSLPFSVRRDSTSASEFIDDEFTDTGAAATRSVDVRRLNINVSPSLNWAATERLTLRFAPAVSETRFDGGDSLFDFRSLSASTTASYLLTERTSAIAAASISHLESPDSPADSKSTTLGATLGAQHKLSPTLTLTGSVGVLSTKRYRTRAGERETDRDTGPQARLSVVREFERGELSAAVSRSRSPTTSGTLVESDSIAATFRHRVAERLTATARASFSRRSAVGFDGDDTSQDTDRYSASLEVVYKMTERINLSGTYSYGLRDQRDSGGRAEKNTLLFSLRVGGPTYSLSR